MRADSHAPRFVSLALGAQPQSLELALDPGLGVTLELRQPLWTVPHELWLLEEGLLGVKHFRHSRSHPMKAFLELRLVKLDSSGKALLRGLAPGRYRLHAEPADLAFDPDCIEIDEQVSSVPIRWRSTE